MAIYNEGFGTLYERLVRKAYLEHLLSLYSSSIDTVLEIKPGLGIDSMIFKSRGKQVCLIEKRLRYILECKDILKNGRVIKSDFLKLPFKPDSFDLVWSSSLIDGVTNPEAYILEMRRVSKRYLLLFVSNDLHPTHFISKIIKEKSRSWMNLKTLSHFINACELEIIEEGNIDSPPWLSGISIPMRLKTDSINPDSRNLDDSGIVGKLASFERYIPNWIKIFTGHQLFVLAEKR